MEGSICAGTNLYDEETPLIAMWCILHPLVAPNTCFWAQYTAKSVLKSTPFAYLFQFHLPLLCLMAVHGLCLVP